MFRRFRPVTIVLFGALSLVPVLGLLQNTWLSRIADAEAVRMQQNLASAAHQLRQAVSGELSVVYSIFALPTEDEPILEALSHRLSFWRSNSEFPGLIDAAYLYRRNGETADLEPIGAPYEVTEEQAKAVERAILARLDPPHRSGTRIVIPIVPSRVDPGNRANGRPDENRPVAYVVVFLSDEFLTGEFIPTMVTRYFEIEDGAYNVAVRVRESGRIVYGRETDVLDTPDIVVPFFPLSAPVRFTAESGRGSTIGRVLDIPAVRFWLWNLRRDDRSRADIDAGPEASREILGVMTDLATTGRLTELVEIGQERIAEFQLSQAIGEYFVLEAYHRSGSLEAAVAEGRRRNAALSAGTLVLLALALIALYGSYRRAERVRRQEREFVATITHELRTPLAVIFSVGENLAEGITEDPVRVRKYGDLVRTEGRRLETLVEKILLFSGIEKTSRNARTVVPLADVVSDAVAMHATQAAENGVEIETRIQPRLAPIKADREALVSAVSNLISNGVKYGGAGGRVIVSTEQRFERNRRRAVVAVRDFGPGIDRDEGDRIFEPFFRGANGTGVSPGSGLGLSFVKRIVEYHGGRVSFQNLIDGGVAFEIVIPTEESKGG